MVDWHGRPVWAEIDLDALAHNVALLKTRAQPAQLYAVVKANAYGHGAVPIARAAEQAGASGFGVINADEGEQLRKGGITAPVVILGYSPPGQADQIVEHRLTPSVHDLETARALSDSARARNVRQPVHLEVETGLNRHGVAADRLVAFAESVRALPGLDVEGLFTHFAAAEEGDKTFTRGQFARLMDASALLPWVRVRHCAATASIMDNPELHAELVRAGLGLYGYQPAPGCGVGMDVRPVMSLKTRIARLETLREGETVGYGRAFRALQPTRVALIMAGYADGLQRRLSGSLEVLVHGMRAPLVGRIAMDMCMIDVTHIEHARVGDEVVLMGSQGRERIDANELAARAGTISWEMLAGVSHRVPRLYLRGGDVVQVTTLNQGA